MQSEGGQPEVSRTTQQLAEFGNLIGTRKRVSHKDFSVALRLRFAADQGVSWFVEVSR